MQLVKKLTELWKEIEDPFLVHPKGELKFSDIMSNKSLDLSDINSGDIIALIGDYDPQSISLLLQLIDKKVIIVPLTINTRTQHEYFFEAALVDIVIERNRIKRIVHTKKHELIEQLRNEKKAGLILFSSGTTGRPKAIVHDLTLLLKRFETPRPTFRTLSFLLFDHMGGLNTLLHTLFNRGTVIAPISRSVEGILNTCEKYGVEVLPTTPTFLRMMLISGLIPDRFPKTIKVISYGSERMDQTTLNNLCNLLPDVDFRQTFGMSELSVVRVKSEARDSLFMKVGGEGIDTRIVNKVLEIRSTNRMLGYLNAPSPFDNQGWYNTQDIVEERNGYYKVTGRTSEVINVAGTKFMASEVERVALKFNGVEFVKAEGKNNPISGQHVELTVQPKANCQFDKVALKSFLTRELPNHMVPKRLKINNIAIGHRYKRA